MPQKDKNGNQCVGDNCMEGVVGLRRRSFVVLCLMIIRMQSWSSVNNTLTDPAGKRKLMVGEIRFILPHLKLTSICHFDRIVFSALFKNCGKTFPDFSWKINKSFWIKYYTDAFCFALLQEIWIMHVYEKNQLIQQ